MKAFSVLLLSIVTSTQQQQEMLTECLNGQLRETTSKSQEYCYHGEWRLICHDDSQWNQERTISACIQLGYSDSRLGISEGSMCGTTERKVVTLTNCSEPGQHLTECIVTASDSCTTCSYLILTCFTVTCIDGEIRMVGGSTDRQGRVEVCVGGRRWRTVCTGSQELAGAVCLRMGYIFEEGTVALPNSFTPGAFPEYRLNCTQLSNGTWHCSPVEQQCDSFVELAVVCKNYEDLYNECSKDYAPSKLPVTTSQSPTTQQAVAVTTPVACAGNSTTFIAVIGVLVALLLAVSVGCIVSCVILLRRGHTVHKQHVDAGTTRSNQSYTQQDINKQLYAEATPPDTTYSRLNRGDKQTEEIATYDYADPNKIRVECSQATHPPPVSGEAIVREEEFYIAEDHTYAAVNKKAKKKKKPKNAESDGEGEGEAPPPFVSTLAEV